MPRTSKTITFSLPPEMANRVDEVMKQQGRYRSEFLREAVLRYIEERSGGTYSSTVSSEPGHTVSGPGTWPA